MLDIQDILTHKPLGLVFDIDGTLSLLVPIPDEAELFPSVASLLEQARDHSNTHVAIMTGRAINSGAGIVNIDGLTYIGTHGLEWCNGLPSSVSSVQLNPEALRYVEPGKHLLDIAEQNLSNLPWCIIERKRVGGSIHYRLSPNPEESRQHILAILTEPAQNFKMQLHEGKRVIEIKPPIETNKGIALRRFVQGFKLEGVIFAGDDRTDLDAIMEVARLRQEGINALSIVVKHTDTIQVLLENGDVIVEGVEGMVKLLHEIVDFLRDRRADRVYK